LKEEKKKDEFNEKYYEIKDLVPRVLFMIQETEDMINLVKNSKYKGDKTEIEICSDYIKDLKKHKLKKIKSIKEKGDKNIKNYKPKNDNKISDDKEEDKKDYNEWVDIDDNMNEKGEIIIEKNTKTITSHKDSELKKNYIKENERRINSLKNSTLEYYAKEKQEKQNKKEKNTKISIKDTDIDDDIYEKYEKQKKSEALLLSEIEKNLYERGERIDEIEKNAAKLASDSEEFYKNAKKIKRNKFMSWTQYNDNDDFKFEDINKGKIICYLSVIFIIIITLVTLLVLFFH